MPPPVRGERPITDEAERTDSRLAPGYVFGSAAAKMDIQSLEASMRGVSLTVDAWQGNAVFVGS